MSPAGGRTWDDPGGPMVQPEWDPWEIGRRARAALANMTDDGRRVMAAQGRHTSDRLAEETLRRRAHMDASEEIAAAMPHDSPWLVARSGPVTESRARERWAATRPRPEDYAGRGNSDYEAWRHHFWRHCGIDPDDLEQDAWLNSGYGIDADDMHHQSPDLDDLVPEQRDDHVQEQTR